MKSTNKQFLSVHCIQSNKKSDMPTSNTHWTRPPGPPIVWRTIDAKEKLNDKGFTDVRLSIQDIPEDRYEEALDHMCQYYLADEAFNKCLRTKTNLDGVNDNRLTWSYCLKLGMSIGAFKVNSSGELGELVGVMILLVSSDENRRKLDEIWMNSKSSGVKKMFGFVNEVVDRFDFRKIYGVDKYLHEWGLSVKPSFRGQKLGVHLLEVWTDVGRKYGISLGMTTFSTPMAQKQGERAGFTTIYSVKYNEALDENGRPLFPNIESDKLTVTVKML